MNLFAFVTINKALMSYREFSDWVDRSNIQERRRVMRDMAILYRYLDRQRDVPYNAREWGRIRNSLLTRSRWLAAVTRVSTPYCCQVGKDAKGGRLVQYTLFEA